MRSWQRCVLSSVFYVFVNPDENSNCDSSDFRWSRPSGLPADQFRTWTVLCEAAAVMDAAHVLALKCLILYPVMTVSLITCQTLQHLLFKFAPVTFPAFRCHGYNFFEMRCCHHCGKMSWYFPKNGENLKHNPNLSSIYSTKCQNTDDAMRTRFRRVFQSTMLHGAKL